MSKLKLTNLFCLIIIFSLGAITVQCQKETVNCEALKTGIFYSYPKNSMEQYVIKRIGDFQYETNPGNRDSIVYKIQWLHNCKYTLQFISCSAKLPADETAFWEKHKLAYEITDVGKDYYTFKGYIDKSSNVAIQSDTIWLKEKEHVVSNELIQLIQSEKVLKKAHFSDTSKYAVLYVYRLNRFAGSKVDMPVYFDDNIICISKNNSAFIFKIFKEGNFNLSAVSANDVLVKKKPAVLPLNIKFGQKYYVNSSAKFVVNVLNDYNPELKIVDAEKGDEEFLNIY